MDRRTLLKAGGTGILGLGLGGAATYPRLATIIRGHTPVIANNYPQLVNISGLTYELSASLTVIRGPKTCRVAPTPQFERIR